MPTSSTAREAIVIHGIAGPDHHAVAHRLDLPGIQPAAQSAHGPPELAGEVGGGFVSEPFGGCREPGKVDEQECGQPLALSASQSPAHAARNTEFRKAFGKRTDQMRTALEEVVVERTQPVAEVLPMTPEQLAVVLDALGIGLWAHHMLHGRKSVPPDLFSNAIGLIVEGIAARAGRALPEGITA